MDSRTRTKNVTSNLVFGIINKIISMLLPFVARTIIIYILGVEYTGLGSLFTSVLSMLNLAELGIGSALIFGMYKPFANGDDNKINAYLSLYRKCYFIIGAIVLGIGLILLPLIPYLIDGETPPDINLYVLYSIYLLQSVLSYFGFAYKSSILLAAQRVDVKSNVSSIVLIIKEIIQIVLLLTLKNYYFYCACLPIFTLAENLICALYVKKHFPQFKCEGKLDKTELLTIRKNISGLIFQKIGGVVLASVDTIVISSFMGLTVLGIYNNYYFIVSTLFGFFAVIQSAIIPSVGNSVQTMSKEKNYELFKMINFIYLSFDIFCAACFLALCQDFIFVWIGEDKMLPIGIVICMTIYLYTHKMSDVCYIFREATGIWKERKYVNLIAAFLNLILNVILINFIGLYGILISTIASLILVYLPFFSYPLFKFYFEDKNKYFSFLKQEGIYAFIASIVSTIVYFSVVMLPVPNVGWFILKLIITICLTIILLLLIFLKTPVFKKTLEFVKRNVLKR